MDNVLILANTGAVVTTILGILGFIIPDRMAAFVSIAPIGLNGRSEVRATYGGFFAALGSTCILLQSDVVFMVAGVAWLGAAVGRIFSAVFDRNADMKNIGGIVLEAGMGSLLVLPHFLA